MARSTGFQSHNSDAHKRYLEMQKFRGPKPVAAAHRIAQENLDVELDLEDQTKMHLVPCRWSRSGWKYVEVDPKTSKFFNNPNRVNSFGIPAPAKHQRGGSMARKSYLTSKSGFSEARDNGNFSTSYGRSFASVGR